MKPEHEREFRDFVAARSAALLRTAYLLTGDVHEAEDLLQTALLASVRHWGGIRNREQPEAYVRRALYRHQANRWRSRSRRPEVVVPPPDRPAGRDLAADAVQRHGLLAALRAVGVPYAVLHPSHGDVAQVADPSATSTVPAASTPTAGARGPGPHGAGPGTDESGKLLYAPPGGGAQAIQVFPLATDPGGGTGAAPCYVLDPSTGVYRKVPYQVVLSPDLTRAAVVDARGRLGVVDRAALLSGDSKRIRWLDLPVGNGAVWSPDGTALLWTAIDKRDGSVSFAAYRYDTVAGSSRRTPITVEMMGSSAGWAANSRDYVVMLASADGQHDFAGRLRYIHPDGTLGDTIDVYGGIGGAGSYSPSRRYVVADTSDLMLDPPKRSTILDVATGRPVGSLPARAEPVGWYDENSVVVLPRDDENNARLEVIDVTTGRTVKTVQLAVRPTWGLQVGSAVGLTGKVAALGF